MNRPNGNHSVSTQIRALSASWPLWLLALIVLSSTANATTLLSVSINQLTEQAEFAFEGKVIAVEAQRSGARGMVSTYVTFRVMDTLKGTTGATSLELKFMGGVFEGEILEVNGSRIPELGEHGIYFVESLTKDLINPLLGWSQGQYLIEATGAGEQVTSIDAQPIVGIRPTVAPLVAPLATPSARSAAPLRIATEPNIADGLIAGEVGTLDGLSPRAFKQQVRALLP